MLNVVDSLPVPERAADYGAQVWQRIEHRIGARRRGLWTLPVPWRWAAAGAAFAALMVTAFVAGRLYPRHNQPAQMAAADPQAGERVLLVAVGDYLERSQMVLIELSNANPKARWISPPSRSAPATWSPKPGSTGRPPRAPAIPALPGYSTNSSACWWTSPTRLPI